MVGEPEGPVQPAFAHREYVATVAGMGADVTDFESEVLERSRNVPVLADFWAPWCGPCRQLAPTLEELSKTMADKVKVVKMNVDESQQIPGEMGIRSIPTLILFKNGQKVDTQVGSMPLAALTKMIESHL